VTAAPRWTLPLSGVQRIFAAFFLYSFCLGGLYPRIGEIQLAMGVGEGALGLALIGTAAGTMISLTWGHPFIARWGHRRSLLTLMPITAISYAAASWAQSPWQLFAMLVPAGIAVGAMEVIVNVEADRAEHHEQRRIMNRAHGFWSVGFFSAALLGSLSAKLGLSPQWQLGLTVLLVVLANWALLSPLVPYPDRPQSGEPVAMPRFARPTVPILWLVTISFSAMTLEGAGIDWSSIYMRDVFGLSPAWAGLAVATCAIAQALVRFNADRFVERYSPVAVARTALCTLALAVVLVFFAPHPVVAYVGFALMGAGTSVVFPLAMSAAAQRHDRPAAINVAALSQLAFTAFLLAPPLLGLVAEAMGIRWAFGVCLPLVLLSLWATRELRVRA
jgi:MFS family permease